MSKPVFWKNIVNLLSAEFAQRVVKVKICDVQCVKKTHIQIRAKKLRLAYAFVWSDQCFLCPLIEPLITIRGGP